MISEAKALKNLIKHSLVNAKKDYYHDMLHRFKHDSKNFWRSMNDLLSRGTTNNIDKILDPVSGKMADPDEAAELLNNYYVSIVDKLMSALPKVDCDLSKMGVNSKFSFDNPISERVLRDILKTIDISPLGA